jgi:hypothetical protein
MPDGGHGPPYRGLGTFISACLENWGFRARVGLVHASSADTSQQGREQHADPAFGPNLGDHGDV